MGTTKKRKVTTKLIDLGPDDLRRLPRPHKGYEAFAPLLGALFRDNPGALGAGDLDIDAMLEHVDTSQALAEPTAEAGRHFRRMLTTQAAHESAGWVAMLEMYARAVAVGRSNAAVRAGIAPFVEFMKVHRRKPKARKPSDRK